MRQLRFWSLNAPSSWPLLAHVLVQPTLIRYTMAYTDG